MIEYCNFNENDIILDFFSGSSTTANAILDYNSKENTNYKFIMVQIPGPTNPKMEAYQAGKIFVKLQKKGLGVLEIKLLMKLEMKI